MIQVEIAVYLYELASIEPNMFLFNEAGMYRPFRQQRFV